MDDTADKSLQQGTRANRVTDHSVLSLLAPDRHRSFKIVAPSFASESGGEVAGVGRRRHHRCIDEQPDAVESSCCSTPRKRVCKNPVDNDDDDDDLSTSSSSWPPHGDSLDVRQPPALTSSSCSTIDGSRPLSASFAAPSGTTPSGTSGGDATATSISPWQSAASGARDESVSQSSADGPKVQLESEDLWKQFYSLCTEMVITKSGR